VPELKLAVGADGNGPQRDLADEVLRCNSSGSLIPTFVGRSKQFLDRQTDDLFHPLGLVIKQGVSSDQLRCDIQALVRFKSDAHPCTIPGCISFKPVESPIKFEDAVSLRPEKQGISLVDADFPQFGVGDVCLDSPGHDGTSFVD
jgi:hypothetical protein